MFALEMLKRKLQGKLERSEEWEANLRKDKRIEAAEQYAMKVTTLREVILEIESMQATHAKGSRL